MVAERLQKVLAQHGLASRRKAEQWIQDGRVSVNGAPAQLGQKVDLTCDRIAVDGRDLAPQPQNYYFLLNKPAGAVSTCSDPEGRPTVLNTLPEALQAVGIHPVGRLDTYSTGALLLTNDGDLTYRLTHPKHDIAKVYHVCLEGRVSAETLASWRQGVWLAGRQTRPAEVTILATATPGSTRLKVTLREGRNRQIRRVAELLGHRVLSLHRIAIGSVHLGNLASGAYRPLSPAEIRALLAESDVQPAVSPPSTQPFVGTSPF